MGHPTGTIYLLHFVDANGNTARYRHAGHYLGWTTSLPERLEAHRTGHGARLMAVIHEAGIGFQLARTWEGPRARERQLKRQGGSARRCPICWAAKPAPSQASQTGGRCTHGNLPEPNHPRSTA